MKPLILTLWNEFEEDHDPTIATAQEYFPIIIAIRVKVTTQNYNQILLFII